MIVKSMARKSASFGQLLAYINRPEAKGPAILQNLVTGADDVAAIHREFLDNFRYLPRRKNGNALYHEVMSFGAGDRSGLTPEVIEDLVRRYLELRAPGLLGYAKAHFDRTCTHVHLLLSANNVASAARLRLGRSRFHQVVVELERYQRRQYPQLKHSLVHEVREGKARARQWRGEAEREKRLRGEGRGIPSTKETVRLQVEEQIRAARSEESLLLRLSLLGLELYLRGSSVGVVDQRSGRRFRLETLGLSEVFAHQLASWARERERLEALERVEHERARREWLERGYRAEVAVVLGEGEPAGALSPTQQTRVAQLARTLREQVRGQRSRGERQR